MSVAGAPTVAVMMGVSGSGKTTLGKALAERLGWVFQEGDDLHPPANIAKMKAGIPLTDADRAPWLARVEAWISDELRQGRSGVIACSALKRAYRDRIVAGRANVRLVFLKGERDLIAARLAHRHGHFMPPSLLDSQFAALEAPAASEHAIEIDISQPLDANVAKAAAELRRAQAGA
jgi:carbohydrate kinase (thermoresistant glucokinase family)